MQWWEKTVEYKFVMLVAQSEELFLAPLDGKHERAGDAIFSTSNKWVLIEFKKDSKSICDEKKKFIQYEQTKRAFASSDNHHHIIYGQSNKEIHPQLELCSQTYFSGISKSSLNIKEILSSGISYKEFSDYVRKLVAHKKGPQGSGAGSLMMSDYSLIAGVNANNQLVACISLTEFQHQLDLELNHRRALSQNNSYSR